MTVKWVSALSLILGGLALIAFETSIYGASPMAANRLETATMLPRHGYVESQREKDRWSNAQPYRRNARER